MGLYSKGRKGEGRERGGERGGGRERERGRREREREGERGRRERGDTNSLFRVDGETSCCFVSSIHPLINEI